MSSRTKLILIAAGFTISHFLVTWFVAVQAWEHDWADRLMKFLWFPARLTGWGGSKFSNAVLMFSNSMLWGLLFATLVAMVCWSLRRRAHD
jgi:hypothetical protein